MKKWIALISVLLVTALSVFTVSAKNAGAAILTQMDGSNHVDVAIELSEGQARDITSLRLQLLVVLERGEIKHDSVDFTFASGITSRIQDVQVSPGEDAPKYLVDIILSGTSVLPFVGDGTTKRLQVGTLMLPDGSDYYAKVAMGTLTVPGETGQESVIPEETTPGETAQEGTASDIDIQENTTDTTSHEPAIQYVENNGMEAILLPLTNAEPVMVGAKEEPTPDVPTEPEPSPDVPTESPTPDVPTESPTPDVPTASPTPASPTPSPTPTPTPSATPVPSATPQLPAPTLKAATKIGTNEVSLSWTEVDGADGYVIYEQKDKYSGYEEIGRVAGKKTTKFTVKAAFGKTFLYSVSAYENIGKNSQIGKSSDSLKVKVPAFDKSAKPEVEVKVNGKQKLVLKWKKVAGADGYQIYQYRAEDEEYVKIATIKKGKTTSYVTKVKAADADASTFKVRAYAQDGKAKVYGKYCVTKVTPKKVTGVKVDVKTKKRAKISWKQVEGADGYCVLRATSKNGDYAVIKTLKGATKLTYTDKKAKAGKTYFYKVAAFVYGPEDEIILAPESKAVKAKIKK